MLSPAPLCNSPDTPNYCLHNRDTLSSLLSPSQCAASASILATFFTCFPVPLKLFRFLALSIRYTVTVIHYLQYNSITEPSQVVNSLLIIYTVNDKTTEMKRENGGCTKTSSTFIKKDGIPPPYLLRECLPARDSLLR